MADHIYLVRHGETEWSLSGQHTSSTDLPLTEHGREQARAVADKLAGIGFSRVLCSPLARARETCRLAGFEQAAQLSDDLREWDYGDYEGVTTQQIRHARPGWSVFTDGCPGGEPLAEVGARADRVIRRVREIDGRVLIFGHGHALRVLAARWIELAPDGGSRLALGTATLSVLAWDRETAVIKRWNAG
jgi:probable phosphoglycerate mutase